MANERPRTTSRRTALRTGSAALAGLLVPSGLGGTAGATTDDEELDRITGPTLEGETRERTVAYYAGSDGVVSTDEVMAAMADWEDGEIDTDLMLGVIDAWEAGTDLSGAVVETVSVTYSVRGKNVLGMTLWTFYERVTWSYDTDGIIESAGTDAWGTTEGTFWSYEGVVEALDHGGAGDESYESYREGKFESCIDILCYQTAHGLINVVVDGDGRHRAEGGPGDPERE